LIRRKIDIKPCLETAHATGSLQEGEILIATQGERTLHTFEEGGGNEREKKTFYRSPLRGGGRRGTERGRVQIIERT